MCCFYALHRESKSGDEDEWEDVEEEQMDRKNTCDEEYDSEGPLSDDSEIGGEMKEFLFMQEETKSRFTEYSMTSSVIKRNEQLTLLDERFEKVKKSFGQTLEHPCKLFLNLNSFLLKIPGYKLQDTRYHSLF